MAKNYPELSIARHFTSSPFTIHVGSDPNTRSTFHIPSSILAARSIYFATLINGSFKGIEASTRTVTLDTDVDRPDAFEVFVDWLFINDYTPKAKTISAGWELTADGTDISLIHARVYVLAERLCAHGLKSLAVGKMTDYLGRSYRSAVDNSKRPWATLNALTFMDLVKTVYPHTSEQQQDGEDDGSGPPEKRATGVGPAMNVAMGRSDPMRMLIARYAGSRIESLRCHPEFRRLMKGCQGCEGFVNDLIVNVKNGDVVVSSR